MNNHLTLNDNSGGPPRVCGGLLNPSNFNPPMPRHQTYIETRGSTEAWIFKKPRSPVEVLNDSDGEAFNFSRAMVESETRLRVLDRYARSINPGTIISMGLGDDRVARAAQFANKIERFTPDFSKRNTQRRLPLEMTLELRRLDHAMERLRGVQLEDSATVDVLRRFDWSRAFFLCDERGTNWDIEQGSLTGRDLGKAQGKITLIISSRPAWLEKDRSWQRLELPNKIDSEEVWTNF